MPTYMTLVSFTLIHQSPCLEMQKRLVDKIINFWFDGYKGTLTDSIVSRWFMGGTSFDSQVKELFEKELNQTTAVIAPTTSKEYLAAIILYDQFPRNIYRNTKKAFSFDSIALKLSLEAIEKNLDNELDQVEKCFIYLPLEHSESLLNQKLSVEKFKETGIETFYQYAMDHMKVIELFGRFPHRNKILERQETEEERAYLENGGKTF